MKFAKHLLVSAIAATITSTVMPVMAGLTVLEKTPEKAPIPPQQVIDEGTRARAENERLTREIERLKSELGRVQAELAAALKSNNQDPKKLAKVNQSIEKMEQKAAEIGTALLRAHFGYASSKFDPPADVGEAMVSAGTKAKRINVRGHSDNTGSAEANRVLAMSRAVAARNYLTARGVEKNKVFVFSRGSSEPLGDNSTEEGRAQNRRVDVEFLQ
jgi:outer membrane protein OmpA-like peptidoglycan-associated protein